MIARLTIVMVLLLARSAPAQVELRWKWQQDGTFYVKTVTTVKQTFVIEDPRASAVRAAGFLPTFSMPLGALSLGSVMIHTPPLILRDRELRQDYEHTSLLRYKVTKRNEDGSAVLTQQVVKDRGKVKGLEDDSVEKPDSTLDDIELTVHVDARGQVTRVEGGDKLLATLAGNDTGKREALRDALSADALQASSSLALGPLPAEPKKQQDQWSQPTQLRLGALGQLRLERTFTLRSLTKKQGTSTALVDFTSRVKDYRPDPIDQKIAGTALLQRQPLGAAATALLARSLAGGIAFRITDTYLTEGDGEGTFEMDLDAGRLKESTSKVKLRGHLTMRNSNVFYRLRLAQEQKVTVTVLDRLPAKSGQKEPSGR